MSVYFTRQVLDDVSSMISRVSRPIPLFASRLSVITKPGVSLVPGTRLGATVHNTTSLLRPKRWEQPPESAKWSKLGAGLSGVPYFISYMSSLQKCTLGCHGGEWMCDRIVLLTTLRRQSKSIVALSKGKCKVRVR